MTVSIETETQEDARRRATCVERFVEAYRAVAGGVLPECARIDGTHRDFDRLGVIEYEGLRIAEEALLPGCCIILGNVLVNECGFEWQTARSGDSREPVLLHAGFDGPLLAWSLASRPFAPSLYDEWPSQLQLALDGYEAIRHCLSRNQAIGSTRVRSWVELLGVGTLEQVLTMSDRAG